MYTIIRNKINNDKIRYQITKQDNSKLTYAEFINLLKLKDENFLDFFKSELSGVQSDLGQTAYFWKCVPVSSNTLNKEFEFVAIKSRDLENITHDYSPFQEYFRSNRSVVSFPSRSGDTLVSPAPVRGHQYSCTDYDDEIRNYKNLREFNCEAPLEQWKELWQKVGEKMDEELRSGNTTRWLNTHGLMVNHLHIRLDKSPKYYQGAEEYQVETQQEHQPQQEVPSSQNDKNTRRDGTNDNYDNWTRQQLVSEIKRLKAENEQLKNNQTLTNSERQARLQQNQYKLDKLESLVADEKVNSQPNKSSDSSLTPWLVGGGILIAVVGLISILVYKRNKNIRKSK